MHNFWYDRQRADSFNPAYYWCIGVRGAGKTFQIAKKGVSRFLKTGKQFMYTRRTEAEMEASKDSLLLPLHMEGYFLDHDLQCRGLELLCDGKVCGHVRALSTAQKYKSIQTPLVEAIDYDEFLVEGEGRYLKNEGQKIQALLETVGRHRDVRFRAYANATSINNPLFNHYNIRPRRGARFTRFKDGDGSIDHLIELWANDEYTKFKKQQKIVKAAGGNNAYSKYMYENTFLNDNYDFVEPMRGKGIYQCTIAFEGKRYGVYDQLDGKGILHVNEGVDPSCKTIFSFTTEDHAPNMLLFVASKQNPFIKRLKFAYDMGCVRFGSITAKNAVYDILDYMK